MTFCVFLLCSLSAHILIIFFYAYLVIVHSVIKFWPKLASRKEILFLNEMEEILEHIQPAQLDKASICIRLSSQTLSSLFHLPPL